MTRQHFQQFHCPNCQTWHSAETSFGRWVRNNKALDSGSGFSVIDCDFWVHKFKTFRSREFQLIMLVEIKTNGAQLSDAQKDTLHIANQVMRNRSETPTKERRFQAGYSIVKARSLMLGRNVLVKCHGVHSLVFSGLGPDDSDSIQWDRKEIDELQLTQLLAFDLDPDTLNPIDLRSHHQAIHHPELF